MAAFRRARLTGPNDEDGATCAVRNTFADAAKRGDSAEAPTPDNDQVGVVRSGVECIDGTARIDLRLRTHRGDVDVLTSHCHYSSHRCLEPLCQLGRHGFRFGCMR
jgi:hypothetical protein